MSFQVYNSFSKKKEPFEPLSEGVVRMYNCGPTVYSRVHIGNWRAFLFADLLRRWLEHEGYEVRQVMNITDVGHLTDEMADEGEDKIEAQARREGVDPWKISETYAGQFLADAVTLGCKEAMVYPRASDHVPQMVEMIEALEKSGHAYRTGENVYFDVTSFENYGALSGNKIDELDAGARIEVNEEKRHPADFALWKSDEHHLQKWDTVFGPHGFPGWHIECSAMARAHLGDQIDIHTGGEDNVFPHHECEIAQSEAFTGEQFARYWMHTKFLQVDGGKMSKSLGNVWNVDDVLERGYEARALRFALLRGHYRQPLNFTWDILAESARALEGLDDLAQRLLRKVDGEDAGEEEVAAAATEFRDSMNDDLNVPKAVAALFTLRGEVLEGAVEGAGAQAALDLLAEADAVLGVLELEPAGGGAEEDAEIDALVAARNAARDAKDWAEADRVRDELNARGIVVEDTADGGSSWFRK
ncbi:MAG: cysteine--tRNA ligase [Planctomycetes bacterium]|nr:cysteine--tRNA ligase [Planctomycetota bacterium]